MSDQPNLSRRALLAAAAGGVGLTAVQADTLEETQGNVWGGQMALNSAYNVAGDLWIGPDSAKSNVDADSGRVYMASDTQVEYYGDSGSWTTLGIGSSSQPVPSVTTEEASITEGSAKINQTSDQSVNSSSVTTIQFDSQDSDHTPGDVLTIDTANNKITIEKDGRYVIKANVTFDNPDDGQRIQVEVKVGSTIKDKGHDTIGTNSFTNAQAVEIIEVSASPVDITATVFQDAGTSKDTLGVAPHTNLSVGRIG